MAAHSEEIEALSAELDEIWPGWRERKAFNEAEPPRKARIKWCLKRREILLRGEDLAVRIIYAAGPDGKPNPARPYAHPCDRGVQAEPPARVPPLACHGTPAPTAALPSLPRIAFNLQIPLENVERARARYDIEKPAEPFSASWVTEHLRQERQNHATP